ncbi:hypothetical protein [Novosphingobium sp. KACC 22771]|nr:hypothetical protein [Novosphingobium sp. KACC 22771]WDF74381.1 hypothetical protein PQ467_20740 [Novosphingobium sp. KACC 22771]
MSREELVGLRRMLEAMKAPARITVDFSSRHEEAPLVAPLTFAAGA